MNDHLKLSDLDPGFDDRLEPITDTDAARLMRAHRFAVLDLQRAEALWAAEEARITEAKAEALAPLHGRIDMLAGSLEGWGRLQMREAERAGRKPAKSWKLPDGTLTSRSTQARVAVENKQIISEEFMVEVLQTKPDTAKVLGLIEDGTLAADEYGTMRHAETGEVITGLGYVAPGRNFSIKDQK